MATADSLVKRLHDGSIDLYVYSCWTAKLLLKAKVDEVKIDSKGKFISIDIDDDETAKPEFNILASESPVKCSKLVGQLRERAQELDDSLHGIVRKEGKIVSRMGGIPADFGWQVRTANEVKLLRDSAAALEKSKPISTEAVRAKVEARKAELIELVKSDRDLEKHMSKIKRDPYAIGYSDAMGKARVTEFHVVEWFLKLLGDSPSSSAIMTKIKALPRQSLMMLRNDMMDEKMFDFVKLEAVLEILKANSEKESKGDGR